MSSRASLKVIIVGGVAGGASAAARLRRLSESAEIILVEQGSYISFANCGLPYYIGGEIQNKQALTLQTPASFHARFAVDVRILSKVVAIDPKNKSVTIQRVESGECYEESYDKLILSPGAEPIRPPLPGIDAPGVFTLRNIPDTFRIKEYLEQHHPQKAVIVGGGFIGVEMAENLHQAGLQVTLLEMQPQLIAPLDADMAAEVHHGVRKHGINLLLGQGLQAITPTETGLSLTTTAGDQPLDADMVILAIGVKPESDLAKQAGLTLTPRGAIVVGSDLRTSDPDIFAVGDAIAVTDFVTGEETVVPLAGPANKQGRIAADQIAGKDSRYTGTQGSAILKVFDLTVASTGLNEKAAKAKGLPYEKVFTYSASHASYYPGATSIAIKILFHPETGKLLGAQLVGMEGVDKRCDVFATAIRLGATVKDLTQLELCYAPPYSSAKDPVNMAGFVAENILSGDVSQFHWHEVAGLPRDGSVFLLDVRTPGEYQMGAIDGFVNIPVDTLRDHLDRLPLDKPIYVTCQVGLRGYLACKILSGHGFSCHNLGGGYRLYHSVQADAALIGELTQGLRPTTPASR